MLKIDFVHWLTGLETKTGYEKNSPSDIAYLACEAGVITAQERDAVLIELQKQYWVSP
jgi:hypothetical protein